jgi:hypothetical protein
MSQSPFSTKKQLKTKAGSQPGSARSSNADAEQLLRERREEERREAGFAPAARAGSRQGSRTASTDAPRARSPSRFTADNMVDDFVKKVRENTTPASRVTKIKPYVFFLLALESFCSSKNIDAPPTIYNMMRAALHNVANGRDVDSNDTASNIGNLELKLTEYNVSEQPQSGYIDNIRTYMTAILRDSTTSGSFLLPYVRRGDELVRGTGTREKSFSFEEVAKMVLANVTPGQMQRYFTATHTFKKDVNALMSNITRGLDVSPGHLAIAEYIRDYVDLTQAIPQHLASVIISCMVRPFLKRGLRPLKTGGMSSKELNYYVIPASTWFMSGAGAHVWDSSDKGEDGKSLKMRFAKEGNTFVIEFYHTQELIKFLFNITAGGWASPTLAAQSLLASFPDTSRKPE